MADLASPFSVRNSSLDWLSGSFLVLDACLRNMIAAKERVYRSSQIGPSEAQLHSPESLEQTVSVPQVP
jgi:hypothetical protein